MALDYKAIGLRLRRRREEIQVSQEWVAEMVDISVTHLSHIENGRTKMSLRVLDGLTEALQMSCDEIMYGKPEAIRDGRLRRLLETASDLTDPELSAFVEMGRTLREANPYRADR